MACWWRIRRSITVFPAFRIPALNTQSAETKDGRLAVRRNGGFIISSQRTDIQQFRSWAALPLIGHLFKRTRYNHVAGTDVLPDSADYPG